MRADPWQEGWILYGINLARSRDHGPNVMTIRMTKDQAESVTIAIIKVVDGRISFDDMVKAIRELLAHLAPS